MKKIILAAALMSLSFPLFAQKLTLKIDYIALNVRDYNKSISFYSKIMGLDSIALPYKPLNKQATWFTLGPALQLHIVSGAKNMVEMNHSHITFTVDSLDAFIRKLDSYQIAWYNNLNKRGLISTRPDGTREIFFRDPDDYEYEVIMRPQGQPIATVVK